MASTSTFTCAWCGHTSATTGEGRDHCPACLDSTHAGCGARMTPIAIAVRAGRAWTVVHSCVRCGELSSAPVQDDDNRLVVIRTAVRPLAQPPFPFEAFGAF